MGKGNGSTAVAERPVTKTAEKPKAEVKPISQADFEKARRAWAAALTPEVQAAYNTFIAARAKLKAGTGSQGDVDKAKAALDKVHDAAGRKVYSIYAAARKAAKELGLTLTPLRAP